MIKILLKTGKGSIFLFGAAAEIGDGISEGVVVFEEEERGELFLVAFLYADQDVALEHEINEDLPLGIETGVYVDFRGGKA